MPSGVASCPGFPAQHFDVVTRAIEPVVCNCGSISQTPVPKFENKTQQVLDLLTDATWHNLFYVHYKLRVIEPPSLFKRNDCRNAQKHSGLGHSQPRRGWN